MAGGPGLLSVLLVAPAAVAGAHLLHRLVALDRRPAPVLPSGSGWAPEQHALSRCSR